MLKVRKAIVGELGTNCYVVTDEATGLTAVIDPGEYTSGLDNILQIVGYDNVRYVILTHAHFDHIGGTVELLEKTGFKPEVAVGVYDSAILNDTYSNLSKMFYGVGIDNIPMNIALNDGDILPLGESNIRVMHTPGHTAGSVSLICDDKIFSGDTMFFCSYGRTDFPTGSESELMQSLKRLTDIEGNYKVYPGHGDTTTLEYERKNNHF